MPKKKLNDEVLEITSKLISKQFASCECMTKSPEIVYHDENCLYRVLSEAVALIQKLYTRGNNV